MRCLVVGGTGFLGGAIADALTRSGHAVTVMSRGISNRALPAGSRVISADRYGDLSALGDHRFQWVFDTCAYAPDAVETLLGAVGADMTRYVMISSISAYGNFSECGLDEDAEVPDATEADLAVAKSVAPENRASAFAYGAAYGPLKRACEKAALARLSDRATCLRVGLLVGAGDYTDRLTWWVRRIDQAHGNRRFVAAPGPANRKVQLVDVRDVADFCRKCANDGLGGVWNVTGKPTDLTAVLGEIIRVSGAPARLVCVEPEAIATAGISPWSEMPLMAPLEPEFRYFLEVGTDRAVSAGLVCRPFEQTLHPLLEWDRRRRDTPLKCGLSPEQEARLLS